MLLREGSQASLAAVGHLCCRIWLLMNEGILRGVAQLVARTAGGREVAGSNPVVPTILHFYNTYAKIT